MADTVRLKTVTYIPNYTNISNTQNANSNPFEATIIEQNVETSEKPSKRNFTENIIDELAKKYEKNPSAIFQEIGINFTEEQKKKIETYLSDKKSLKAFMQFIAQENLTKEDIVAGIEKLQSMPETSWLTRVKNVVKTTFSDGIEEAIKLAKSERVYKAEKLSDSMDAIRDERQDFSAETVANISYETIENAEIKDNIMHFVTKKDTQNIHLYDENSTNKAVNYMVENEDKADIFTANAAEIESIQDSNKQTKYKGSTIVNVSERITEAPELKETILTVGKKRDMNDTNFDNITNNLFKNPNMKDAIDFMATAIDKDGKDRFSAENLNKTSEHLLDKVKEYCQKYKINIKDLTEKSKLGGNRITQLTEILTEHPEIKDVVMNKLETTPNMNDEEFILECQKYIEEKRYENNNTQTNSFESEENLYLSYASQANTNAENTTKAEEQTGYIEEAKTIEIKGEYYDRKTVLKYLNEKFEMKGEAILQTLEHTPGFIDYIKEFVQCKDILPQLINNPNECIAKINKFKNASSTLTAKEMNELVALSTNSENTEILASQVETYGVTQAIKFFKEAKYKNCLDEAKEIYTTNTLNRESKKEKLDNLIQGQNNSFYA